MTRTAKAIAAADDAAEALLDWLRAQPVRPEPNAVLIETGRAEGREGGPDSTSLADATASETADPDRPGPARRPEAEFPSLRLPNPDWLHHRLTISGPADELARFRDAAAGAGLIPWHYDGARMEEDFFHLLVAHPRELSLAGARIFARQLRDAVERRHALAVSCVGRSRACPFDLHALVPVPADILALGPDEPAAVAWLWEHWGTTELRHVLIEPAHEPDAGLSAHTDLRLSFWSADWTPWRALAQIRSRWPRLRFEMRPSYE